jgi:hypothetical protein
MAEQSAIPDKDFEPFHTRLVPVFKFLKAFLSFHPLDQETEEPETDGDMLNSEGENQMN